MQAIHDIIAIKKIFYMGIQSDIPTYCKMLSRSIKYILKSTVKTDKVFQKCILLD